MQIVYFCAELVAWIEHGTFGTRSLELTLTALPLVAAVVRKVLKTRVLLGNISRVLLNIINVIIFVMFKYSSSLSIFTQLRFLFSISSQITAASHLNFCTFALWVGLLSWYLYSIGKKFFTGRSRITLAFLIITNDPFCVRIPTR